MNATGPDTLLAFTIKARDQQLVSAAQAGSPAAFEELRELYSRRVYRRAYAITKNREDAEDAMQDAFLRAYVALNRFEGRSSFSTWLTRIASNSALMILRKRRTRSEVSFEPFDESEDKNPGFEIEDGSPDPEQVCEQRQRCSRLRTAIRTLGPSLRAAIEFQLAHSCSVKEIAEALHISEAAVKARLFRARARLATACGMGSIGARRYAQQVPERRNALPASQPRRRPCMNSI
jgi:RNA polymerase sigma-70 factor, ECF subfamily